MKGNIMKITKLKVNRIVNPIGFDLGKPRISGSGAKMFFV
jgi:hypothetical protein